MKKWFIAGMFLALMLALLASVAGCGSGEVVAGGGTLPVLKVGDKWVYTVTFGQESATTMQMEVTGEEIVNDTDCYIIAFSADNNNGSSSGVTMTMSFDKASLWPVKAQSAGLLLEGPVDTVTTTTPEFPEAFPWPLEAGKEFKVIETSITTFTINGKTNSQDRTETSTWRVEKIEDVTVPAGTFKCHKIVKYNENGSEVEARWYSDQVKLYVKFTAPGPDDTEQTMQLISYES